jgi:hypothetical protein
MSTGPITISFDDETFHMQDLRLECGSSDSQSDSDPCSAGPAVATQLGNKRSCAPPPPGGIKKKPKRRSL